MTDYWKWTGIEITAWKRRVQQSVDCVQKGYAFLNSIRVWTGNGRKRLRRENGIWYCAKIFTKAISNSRITFFKLVSFRYLKLFFFNYNLTGPPFYSKQKRDLPRNAIWWSKYRKIAKIARWFICAQVIFAYVYIIMLVCHIEHS